MVALSHKHLLTDDEVSLEDILAKMKAFYDDKAQSMAQRSLLKIIDAKDS